MARITFAQAVAEFFLDRLMAGLASGTDDEGRLFFVDAHAVSSAGVDATPAVPVTDDELGGAATIGTPHWAIHHGIAYRMFREFTIVGATTDVIQIKTGAKESHFRLVSWDTNAPDSSLTLTQAPTITDGDAAIAIINANQNSLNATANLAYSNPTNVSGGTVLDMHTIGGGTGNGQTASGGGTAQGEEIELKPNTSYTITVAGTDVVGSYRLFWYEVED